MLYVSSLHNCNIDFFGYKKGIRKMQKIHKKQQKVLCNSQMHVITNYKCTDVDCTAAENAHGK